MSLLWSYYSIHGSVCGLWYRISTNTRVGYTAIGGGNTTIINNSGNAPTGSGGSESFSLPFVTDNCFCFSLDLQQSNASSATANDGSITTTSYAGNPPFTYEWSNGATTQNLNNVAQLITLTGHYLTETVHSVVISTVLIWGAQRI